MTFRDIWWKEILKLTNRLAASEWGGKFVVLTPGENVPFAEADLYKKLHKALKGYWYVQKHTPNNALDVEEREAKADSKRRVGRLATGLREAIGDYNDMAGALLDVESDHFVRPQIPSVRPPRK
jgi:hypothetical protein